VTLILVTLVKILHQQLNMRSIVRYIIHVILIHFVTFEFNRSCRSLTLKIPLKMPLKMLKIRLKMLKMLLKMLKMLKSISEISVEIK
jgi:hypothetical protein